jgi:methylase of polypeptide subunit release factors
MGALQAEVGRHEPASALRGGGADGMADLFAVAGGVASRLAPGGFFGVETGGKGQARRLASHMQCEEESEGGSGLRGAFSAVSVEKDLFGVERFVVGIRS